MSAWKPIPEPMKWTLPKPIEHGGLHYAQLTIGAPTSEDVLKATAIYGAAPLDVTLRIIESASAERVPYDVLKKQPHWFNQQVSDYLEEFVGTPAPDPLETWRRERRDAAAVEAKACAEKEAVAQRAAHAASAAMAPAS